VLSLEDRSNDAVRKLHSPSLDSHDDKIAGPIVQLDYFFGHAAQRPVHRARVEQSRIVGCHRPAI
jgi:hypothetical protein